MLPTNDAYVLDLRYHPFSVPTLGKNGHVFEGHPTKIVVLNAERSIVFLLNGPRSAPTATGSTAQQVCD